MWDRMESNKLIDKKEEKNVWSGYYWALENRRSFSCGTNTMSVGGENTLYFNWAASLLNSQSTKGLFRTTYLEPLLQKVDTGKEIEDKHIMNQWCDWGVLTPDGELKIPVIEEYQDNMIFKLSNAIIDKLLSAFVSEINFNTIREKYNLTDNKQTIVVFYHEIMWDLMDLLIENKFVIQPSVFTAVDNNNLSHIKNLLFIKKMPAK
jgi:hypothetical protein